jgi:hypothetical protein
MTTLPPPVSALSAWVGETIANDDARAAAVLSAASGLVRGYAGQAWADSVPDDVAAIVVQVAARVWRNPSGAVSRTAGPFSESYASDAVLGLFLTESEQSVLNRFRVVASGLGTVSTTREDPGTGTIYVPTGPAPSGYPFPWYAADGY